MDDLEAACAAAGEAVKEAKASGDKKLIGEKVAALVAVKEKITARRGAETSDDMFYRRVIRIFVFSNIPTATSVDNSSTSMCVYYSSARVEETPRGIGRDTNVTRV